MGQGESKTGQKHHGVVPGVPSRSQSSELPPAVSPAPSGHASAGVRFDPWNQSQSFEPKRVSSPPSEDDDELVSRLPPSSPLGEPEKAPKATAKPSIPALALDSHRDELRAASLGVSKQQLREIDSMSTKAVRPAATEEPPTMASLANEPKGALPPPRKGMRGLPLLKTELSASGAVSPRDAVVQPPAGGNDNPSPRTLPGPRIAEIVSVPSPEQTHPPAQVPLLTTRPGSHFPPPMRGLDEPMVSPRSGAKDPPRVGHGFSRGLSSSLGIEGGPSLQLGGNLFGFPDTTPAGVTIPLNAQALTTGPAAFGSSPLAVGMELSISQRSDPDAPPQWWTELNADAGVPWSEESRHAARRAFYGKRCSKVLPGLCVSSGIVARNWDKLAHQGVTFVINAARTVCASPFAYPAVVADSQRDVPDAHAITEEEEELEHEHESEADDDEDGGDLFGGAETARARSKHPPRGLGSELSAPKMLLSARSESSRSDMDPQNIARGLPPWASLAAPHPSLPRVPRQQLSYLLMHMEDSAGQDLAPVLPFTSLLVEHVRIVGPTPPPAFTRLPLLPLPSVRQVDLPSQHPAVLVHCHQGVSRSGTLALAHMMWALRLPMQEALTFARTRRGIISPNPGFLCQLLELEDALISMAAKRPAVLGPTSSAMNIPTIDRSISNNMDSAVPASNPASARMVLDDDDGDSDDEVVQVPIAIGVRDGRDRDPPVGPWFHPDPLKHVVPPPAWTRYRRAFPGLLPRHGLLFEIVRWTPGTEPMLAGNPAFWPPLPPHSVNISHHKLSGPVWPSMWRLSLARSADDRSPLPPAQVVQEWTRKLVDAAGGAPPSLSGDDSGDPVRVGYLVMLPQKMRPDLKSTAPPSKDAPTDTPLSSANSRRRSRKLSEASLQWVWPIDTVSLVLDGCLSAETKEQIRCSVCHELATWNALALCAQSRRIACGYDFESPSQSRAPVEDAEFPTAPLESKDSVRMVLDAVPPADPYHSVLSPLSAVGDLTAVSPLKIAHALASLVEVDDASFWYGANLTRSIRNRVVELLPRLLVATVRGVRGHSLPQTCEYGNGLLATLNIPSEHSVVMDEPFSFQPRSRRSSSMCGSQAMPVQGVSSRPTGSTVPPAFSPGAKDLTDLITPATADGDAGFHELSPAHMDDIGVIYDDGINDDGVEEDDDEVPPEVLPQLTHRPAKGKTFSLNLDALGEDEEPAFPPLRTTSSQPDQQQKQLLSVPSIESHDSDHRRPEQDRPPSVPAKRPPALGSIPSPPLSASDLRSHRTRQAFGSPSSDSGPKLFPLAPKGRPPVDGRARPQGRGRQHRLAPSSSNSSSPLEGSAEGGFPTAHVSPTVLALPKSPSLEPEPTSSKGVAVRAARSPSDSTPPRRTVLVPTLNVSPLDDQAPNHPVSAPSRSGRRDEPEATMSSFEQLERGDDPMLHAPRDPVGASTRDRPRAQKVSPTALFEVQDDESLEPVGDYDADDLQEEGVFVLCAREGEQVKYWVWVGAAANEELVPSEDAMASLIGAHMGVPASKLAFQGQQVQDEEQEEFWEAYEAGY
jgi:hypothetical protein